MEAVPRLPTISCDIKRSPNNTEFGYILKKYIRDHYHEDAESYSKEIKELETLRQNAIKAPMDFTGCSILKRYYAQLHKLQSRFPMTDDGPACVPFMWTDIYSGVAYNITDIEYEEACILYNIGALHSELGTIDSRNNAEGMKIACTHFQCAAWAFQHLRDTYPQPKGSDMSHDLLTFFINIMLAQAQECILEKSMLDNRKCSITAKIAAQVVDYYKCSLGIMVSGSPSTDTGSILDIVGSNIFKDWKKFIEFKMTYYASISHLYMGNQAEENQKWGERVSWFQSAFDQLTEAFKIAKGIDRKELSEPLTFTMDVIGGKYNSSKKENEFVYHDKVPALSSLPELKGASLVKGIPFSITDPDVSGPDIFARLVPMEAHETSSLYSEEKAKLLRSIVARIEGKNEELVAYLSSLQYEISTSYEEDEKIPQELLERCAAMSVRPNAISDLKELLNELLSISVEVDASLKSTFALLLEDEKKELQHQETFGKRMASPITSDLKRECAKYEEAHKKAIESNKTLEMAINLHVSNLEKLLLPLEELAAFLPSMDSVKTPENVKIMGAFYHLVSKVDEMRKQRHYLEQQLRDSLMNDDITKSLVTMKKKEDLEQVFAGEMKKHSEVTTYIDQNLSAQDNILCALTEANAQFADTRAALTAVRIKRAELQGQLINSYEVYDDVVSKAKNGIDFYQKLQSNVSRLLTRVRGVVKVQDEERSQSTEIALRKGQKVPRPPIVSSGTPTAPSSLPTQHVPKLKDYLPYMTKQGGAVTIPPGLMTGYPPQQHQIPSEPIRQATLGGPTMDDAGPNMQHLPKEIPKPEDMDTTSMGVRPAPLGSEQTSVPAMCTTAMSNTQVGNVLYPSSQQWPQTLPASVSTPSSYNFSPPSSQYPGAPNIPYPLINANRSTQNYNATLPSPNVAATNHFAASSAYTLPTNSTQNTTPTIPKSYTPNLASNVNSTITPSSTVPGSFSQIPAQITSTVSASSYQYSTGVPYSSNSFQPNVTHGVQAPQVQSNPPGHTQSVPPTQMPPSWQMLPSGQYVPVAGYNVHPTVYDQKQAPNVNTYQPQMQYYNPDSHLNSSLSSSVGSRTNNASQQANSVYLMQQNPTSSSQSTSSLYQNQTQNYASHHLQNSMGSALPSNAITSQGISPLAFPTNYSNSAISPNQPAYYTSNMPQISSNPLYATGMVNPPTAAIPQSGQVTNSPYSTSNIKTSANMHQVNPVSNAPYTETQTAGYVPNTRFVGTPNVIPSTIPPITQAPPSLQYAGTYPQTPNVSISQIPPAATNQAYFGTATPTNANIPVSNVHTAIQNANPGVNMPQGIPTAPQTFYAGMMPSVPNASAMPSNQLPSNSTYSAAAPNGMSPIHAAVSPSGMAGYVSQQNYVPPPNSTQQPPSVSGTPCYSIPNAAPQAFTQPISPAPSQPLQPSPLSTSESKSSLSSVDPSVGSANPHLNTIRDLITPPLEEESAKTTDSTEKGSKTNILQPTVIDLKSIPLPKEKEPVKDPLDDPSVRTKFVSEVEKYEKFVEGLVRKSLNGTTPLDQKWKELTDAQDKESRKLSISVARCYPLKNRHPDVMPYDSNRVQLTSAKDDFINASYLKDICPSSPVFIITQAPLPDTYFDFWLMVWEQQVETLICLIPDAELKNHFYFPKERGQVTPFGVFEMTVQSCKEKNGFIERMINVAHTKNRTSRVVVHLQFTQWPGSGIPQSPAALLQFVSDALFYQKQQRNLMRPVVVHCSSGVGRSGCFCLITALVNEMNSGHGPRDVALVLGAVSQQRKFLIQDKEQFKFCYDTVLYYAQDLLMKRGILTTRASFEDKLPGSGTAASHHVRHPSEDFILGSGGLAKLQSGMEQMGLATDAPPNTEDKPPTSQTSPNHTPADTASVPQSEEAVVPDPVIRVVEVVSPTPDPEEDGECEKGLPSITSLLDPSTFTLDGAGSPARRKITKENFAASRGSLSTSSSDSADPLSQLDPLWSMKK